jgi:anaerobic carbon-monoxide dehydrogenase iron sulfur subunit
MPNIRPAVFIRTHFDACTGCQLCQAACSLHVFGGYNPGKSMLKIRRMWENLVHVPVVCEQCADPICQRVCPVQAIARDEQTGAVVIDQEKCISCGLCSQYCPLEMIHVELDTNKAYKCDLCGGQPACVQACPVQALELVANRDAREGQNE